MNWAHIEEYWPKWQPVIGRQWNKLTDEDLSSLSGNRGQLAEKISECYDISSEEAERQITTWLSNQ